MAVMGRCVGIPTRYVEGFVTNDSKRYGGQLIELPGDSAHAWTEAYIDNIGWIVLEPTPGYYDGANTAWLRLTPGAMDDTKPEVQEVEQPAEEEPVPVEEQGKFLQEEKGRYLVKQMWEAALLLTVLVCTIVIFLLIRHVARRRRYLSRNRQERLGILMRRFLYLGELYGFSLEGGETLSAYEKRVCRAFVLEERHWRMSR